MMESSVSVEEVAVADFHWATWVCIGAERKQKISTAAWRWRWRWRRAAIDIDFFSEIFSTLITALLQWTDDF